MEADSLMEAVFLAPAPPEFADAVMCYNTQRDGLGEEFAEEVQRTIARIIEYPEAWSSLSRRTRRCPMNRFPYGIMYQLRGNTLLIIAVMHLHRAPQHGDPGCHGGSSRLAHASCEEAPHIPARITHAVLTLGARHAMQKSPPRSKVIGGGNSSPSTILRS
jgi:hypothetical protein